MKDVDAILFAIREKEKQKGWHDKSRNEDGWDEWDYGFFSALVWCETKILDIAKGQKE